MAVIWIAGQTASCLDRFGAAGENGDAVPAFLAVPDGPVAGLADRRLGKFLLRCLEFLQANHVRVGLGQPSQQHRQSAVDAVDIEGRELHAALIRFVDSRRVKLISRAGPSR